MELGSWFSLSVFGVRDSCSAREFTKSSLDIMTKDTISKYSLRTNQGQTYILHTKVNFKDRNEVVLIPAYKPPPLTCPTMAAGSSRWLSPSIQNPPKPNPIQQQLSRWWRLSLPSFPFSHRLPPLFPHRLVRKIEWLMRGSFDVRLIEGRMV